MFSRGDMKAALVFLCLFSSTLLNAQGLLQLQHPTLAPEKAQFETPEPPAAIQGKKSPGLAILFSALLPGMGELYAGTFSSSGKYFTMAEGSFLVTYIGMNTYSRWQKDNYKAFAASNANLTGTNLSDDFYADISNYSNIKQFNDEKMLYGQTSQRYDPAQFNWSWASETQRKEYRTMWVASQQANNNLRFVIGAMLLNRLVSIIDAVRSVTAYNRHLTETSAADAAPKFQLSASPFDVDGVALNCRYSF